MRIRDAFGLVLVSGLCGPALAEVTICNELSARQSVAIGYEDPDGNWASEGWWRIEPGACKTVMARALGRDDLYFRTTAAGGGFDGPFAFCTRSDPFTIIGDENCAARGYERTRFRKVDTGGADPYVMTLMRDGAGEIRAVAADDDAHQENGMIPMEASAPFLQGQLGEPFSQAGVFSGCHTIDGLDFCAFEVEGWRYHAYYGGGTPDRVLDEMQDWPVPLSVALTGDMIGYGDITVEVALGRVTERLDGDPFAGLRQGLQGEWQSADDPNSQFRVVGSDVYDIYDAHPVGHHWMQLAESCPDAPGLGIGWTRTTLETQDSWCVILSDLTGNRLELVNPGRGNILTYFRID